MKKLIYTGALLLASLAHAQEVHTMDTGERDVKVVQQLIDRHFAIWNDTDGAHRTARYADLYTENILVADYAGMAVGYAKLDQMIAGVQGKHAGFKFRPDPVTWNHGLGRVTWGYGPDSAPDQIRGEDIFTIEGGKLASLRVFIDKK
jgi:hypothetical protein